MKTIIKMLILTMFWGVNINSVLSQTAGKSKIVIFEDGTTSISNDKFNIQIKLDMHGADSTGGLITITKNGAPYKTINSAGVKYNVALDLNAKYFIKCSKKGYVTKVVFFDTDIPAGREKEEFARFTTLISLVKETNGEKIDSNKPVGGVKYDPIVQDFNFTKN